MTVAIETGYTLTDGKHARIMHAGVALPFTVDAANTTDVDSASYADANIINGLTSDRYKPNATSWTIEIDLTGGSTGVSAIAIGSDDLFTSGQTVTVQYDDGGFTTIDSVTPTDNGPILFLFDTKTSATFRITGSGSAKPTIYNVMIGNPLVMERPFYAGFTPARMNRGTEVIGNLSGSGELLGRSIKRSVLFANYAWQNLTYSWVRSNLDGTSGLIQSVEAKQAYVAWRPSEVGDVDYLMRAATTPPASQGVRNLWSFGLSGEVHSYE